MRILKNVISFLVNNVGKQYEYPMYLGEVPEQDLIDIININVTTVTLMCRAFIGAMKKRGCGAIVNVSSGSELQPLPLMTVYAATKVSGQVFQFKGSTGYIFFSTEQKRRRI